MARQESKPRVESELGEYKGHPIEKVLLEVTKTGYGLERSLEVEPVLLEIGDKAGVLILGETIKHRYEGHKYEKGELDRDGLDRVQILEAEGAIVLPADSPELKAVRSMIAEIARREKEKRDARRGQLTTDQLAAEAAAANGSQAEKAEAPA